jgi:hypothetical protein
MNECSDGSLRLLGRRKGCVSSASSSSLCCNSSDSPWRRFSCTFPKEEKEIVAKKDAGKQDHPGVVQSGPISIYPLAETTGDVFGFPDKYDGLCLVPVSPVNPSPVLADGL